MIQCKTGHSACSACCEKTGNATGCPLCSQPYNDHIRNIVVEQIIGSLQVECKNPGCNTMVKYTDRKEHEDELCEHGPIKCPVRLPQQCQHVCPNVAIPSHLAEKHNVEIVECPGSSTSASFKMKPSSYHLKMMKTEKASLLITCFTDGEARPNFYCTAIGASKGKKVVYKLTAEPVLLNFIKTNIVYSLQTVAPDHLHHRDAVGYLVIPYPQVNPAYPELEFKMTVSLLSK